MGRNRGETARMPQGTFDRIKVGYSLDRDKPGRALHSIDLSKTKSRLRLAGGSRSLTHAYTVHMDPGVVAGNHFHREKAELLFCERGIVRVHLVDPGSEETMSFVLDANAAPDKLFGLVIPPGIAHAVKNVASVDPDEKVRLEREYGIGLFAASLLVFSTGAPRKDDDHHFDVMEHFS